MLASNKRAEFQSAAYREFSRQRSSYYQGKYPLLRELDITNFILEEWEELSPEQRLRLSSQQQMQNLAAAKTSEDCPNKIEAPLLNPDVQDNQAKNKLLEALAPPDGNQKYVRTDGQFRYETKSEPGRRAELQLSEVEKRESYNQTPEQSYSEWQDRQSQLVQPVMVQNQPKPEPESPPNREYIQFYKFYYERLLKEHPRWSGCQRTKIISLLWKKRLSQAKREREMNLKRTKKMRDRSSNEVKEDITQKLKNKRVTAFQLFVRKQLMDKPSESAKEIRDSAFCIWKTYHAAGKNYFERLAEEHNRKVPGAANLPTARGKQEDTNTTNSQENVFAFMHELISPPRPPLANRKGRE